MNESIGSVTFVNHITLNIYISDVTASREKREKEEKIHREA